MFHNGAGEKNIAALLPAQWN